VSLDDWVLSLHVLSAFAMVGAMTLFWILIVAMRDVDTVEETIAYGRVAKVGNTVVIAGVVGTVVFGVWLAISRDEYQLWDGWIIAAFVLWAIGTETGRRAGVEYTRPLTRADELRAAGREGEPGELRALNRAPTGLVLHGVSSAAVALVLLDMIWKPGA
jgi:hypothetical protein